MAKQFVDQEGLMAIIEEMKGYIDKKFDAISKPELPPQTVIFLYTGSIDPNLYLEGTWEKIEGSHYIVTADDTHGNISYESTTTSGGSDTCLYLVGWRRTQ